MLLEFGIKRGKQIVEDPLSEQHDLYIQWDRVRLQRDRACQAQQIDRVFYPDLARLQRPFQGCPGKRLRQDRPRIEKQEATIGAVKGA